MIDFVLENVEHFSLVGVTFERNLNRIKHVTAFTTSAITMLGYLFGAIENTFLPLIYPLSTFLR